MARKPARFAELKQTPDPEPAPPPMVEAEAEAQAFLPMKAPVIQKSRQGKKNVSVYVSNAQAKALRIMAVKQERTLEDIAREAFNEILRKYGEHPEE